jgi:hypothetical protein
MRLGGAKEMTTPSLFDTPASRWQVERNETGHKVYVVHGDGSHTRVEFKERTEVYGKKKIRISVIREYDGGDEPVKLDYWYDAEGVHERREALRQLRLQRQYALENDW